MHQFHVLSACSPIIFTKQALSQNVLCSGFIKSQEIQVFTKSKCLLCGLWGGNTRGEMSKGLSLIVFWSWYIQLQSI